MEAIERTRADYCVTGLTTGPHPMALIRERATNELAIWTAEDLKLAKTGTRLRIAGQVICRQRPGTAKGFVFISLEDETGTSNAIVSPDLFERCRLTISQESFLIIEGIVQNVDRVINVRAITVTALKYGELLVPDSHDFH